MITLSTNSVGKDAFFREIHAGDTVQDMDGTKYTVDQHGGCKPLSGSGYTHLSKLKEPALVNGPATLMPDGRMHTGPIDTSLPVKVSGPSGDVPTSEELKTKPSLGDMMSAAKNKSGFVALENMVRGSKVSGKDLRRILDAAGVEVVTRKKKAMIRIEDRIRAGELLRQADNDPSLIPPKKPRKKPVPKAQKMPVALPLKQEVVDAIKQNRLGDHIRIEPAIGRFSDQELADELRKRGYTLTAVKHIEL